MANPQKEKGYTPIANEIIEALAKTNLSPHESRILWTILRHSYGWNKKETNLTLRQISQFTDIDVRLIPRTVKKLQKRNLITKNGNIYELQKDYHRWVSSAEMSSVLMTSAEMKTIISTDVKLSSVLMITTPKKTNNNKGLQAPKSYINHNINQSLYSMAETRERLMHIWEKTFPKSTFPKSIPLEKIDYFFYKVEEKEINVEQIRSAIAYIKSLEPEHFPNILEREERKQAKIRAEMEARRAEMEERRKEEEAVDREENRRKVKEIIESLSGKKAMRPL